MAKLALALFGVWSTDAADTYTRYEFKSWSDPIKTGFCSNSSEDVQIRIPSKFGSSYGVLHCALEDGVKAYRFPAGIFEIGEQLLVPENVSISGINNPNDMSNPTTTPNWRDQTLFLATRGTTDYKMNYCHAKDMVTTRVGFVLSSYVTVRNLSYQGIDVIRPQDNGGLCGGGAFETKGCAENDCSASDVNNGGSDGFGSISVTIENVRINDYLYAEDRHRLGTLPTPCCSDATEACLFCQPNGIRSTQVGVWVPDTRNQKGTRNLFVNNLVSRSHQADAINLHGNVHDAVIQNVHMENTGDDMFVLWGADKGPTNITFRHCTAVNPGITRPGWYGNCGATYGIKSLVYENITCKAPTLTHPIPAPGDGELRCDSSMFGFFTSFGAVYSEDNRLDIKGWAFENLEGQPYTAKMGKMDQPEVGKMAWTEGTHPRGVIAPYYFPGGESQQVNVYVAQSEQEDPVISV